METQNKLEKHHVAKRLPYGLKVWNCEMLVDFDLTIQEEDENTIDIESVIEYSKVWKPILFPLSCLTETITIKGKSFIPIEELAKIELTSSQYQKLNLESKRIYQNNNDCVFEYFHNSKKYSFYYSKKWGCFRFSNKCPEKMETKNLFVFEQKSLLEKLNEWMFDTDSLIEKGLAVNKNEI